MSTAYAKAGVDIVKADQFVGLISGYVKSTQSKNVIKVPNGYAGLYRLDKDTMIAATTDGVGTKLKLAIDLGIHNTVGIDLVAMSVNDLICVGAKPLFFLDYFATGKLDLGVSTAVLKGISDGCRESGMALIGGETAEMPGMYAAGDYDLAGFAVGIVQKKELLDGRSIRTGDVLIGLASSGIHSNGYSLVRKLLRTGDEAFMKKCLTPTKLYVKAAEVLKKSCGAKLKGLAHITGSGFLNIPRLNDGFDYEINLDLGYKTPEVFTELGRRGGLTSEELFTTFNMGLGLIAVVDKAAAGRLTPKVLVALKKAGYAAFPVGQVGKKISKKSSTPTVRVLGSGYSLELKY